MRTSLTLNKTITLESKIETGRMRKVNILEKLGSGASCIAYKAIDNNSGIPLILKECFPRNAAVRDSSGAIQWNSLDEETHAKERFINSFETQLTLQSTEDTMNTSTHLIDGLYVGNNTLYTVNDIQSAKSYDAVTDAYLQEIFITAKAITRAIGQYHNQGLLHLDIKPQNILILPETRDMVKLLDFDSIIKKSDAVRVGVSISYTHDYAAPELLQGRRSKLCEATDLYAIGAVIFSKIMGHTPTADDRGTFADWDLSVNPLFKRTSNKVQRLTKELYRGTLSASVHKRYQSASELIAALDELARESDPTRRHLNSTCPISANRFFGRNTELRDIHSAFVSGKRVVFLHGMGGIGKTELALQYAKQYSSEYDAVAFGRFTGSLAELFSSTDFILIENNSESSVDIETVRKLADERTLLIIDNFDTETDPNLDAVLSLNCKLLITSRYSFEEMFGNDSHIEHIQPGRLSPDAQVSVFEHECGKKLTTEDVDVVRDILLEIDGLTLLIALIAKQYKKGGYSLDDTKQNIHDAGVKGASNVAIHHFKDSRITNSMYEILCKVLNMEIFNENECFVMRSLALLDDITIDRKKFNSLLGGQYTDTINSLADRSWIQLQGIGEKARILQHRIISELVRDKLKPDLENCKWAMDLCKKITNDLAIREEDKKLEFWEMPKECGVRSGHEVSVVVAARRRRKARRLLKLLSNLDYSESNNIILSVELLSVIIPDIRFLDGNNSNDISIVNDEQLVDDFLDLLNVIADSAILNELSGELRFETYRMLSTVLLTKHLIGGSYHWYPEQKLSVITRTVFCLRNAETAINDIEDVSDLQKEQYYLRLVWPVVTYALSADYILFSLLYGRESSVQAAVDTLFGQVFDILRKAASYAEDTMIFSKESTDYYFESTFPFQDEFERRRDKFLPELKRQEHMLQYGYHIEGADEDEYQNDRSYETWLAGGFTLDEVSQEEAEKLLNSLLTDSDSDTLKDDKISHLLYEIDILGFGPQLIMSHGDRAQECLKNIDKAKKYMKFLESLLFENVDCPDDDDYISQGHWEDYYRQTLILACCTGDTDEQEKLRLIHDFYTFKYDLSCSDNSTMELNNSMKESWLKHIAYAATDVYKTLDALGSHDIAIIFVSEGIRILENELNIATENEDLVYVIYVALASLAQCVNDRQRIRKYVTASVDILEVKLRNDCEDDDQRYETLCILLDYVKRIDDTHRFEQYSAELQLLVGQDFEI